MRKLGSRKGFTLIELMIVVAIIGILAAIAIPQFANMVTKSQEGATKGNLGTIRSALSIYYGDTEGFYPIIPDANNATALADLATGQKYLKSIPTANLPKHAGNTGHGSSFASDSTDLGAANPGDGGGWLYDGNNSRQNWGHVVAGCTHVDTRGAVWTGF